MVWCDVTSDVVWCHVTCDVVWCHVTCDVVWCDVTCDVDVEWLLVLCMKVDVVLPCSVDMGPAGSMC